MPYAALRSISTPRRDRRRRRNRALLAVSLSALCAAAVTLGHRSEPPAVTVATLPEAVPAPVPLRRGAADYAWMFDPSPTLGRETSGLVSPSPDLRLASAAQPADEPPVASVGSPMGVASAPPVPEVAVPAVAVVAALRPTLSERAALSVPLPIPLPVPRPPEFRREATARLARAPAMPSTQSVFRAARAEEPSLFERIFGGTSAPAALGYASLEGESKAIPSRERLVPAPAPTVSGGTAVYDITAQRVTLPNGEVLEAHSGLGPSMDNPRNVHLTMRGATPPGTYDLTEREALFHGVRAIRLNPVGGPGAVKNRVGLLAHTYMLGPSGASNGCVSFRDYNRFLQAYLRGEVRRLVVVAGDGQDGPSWGGRMFGMSGRRSNGG